MALVLKLQGPDSAVMAPKSAPPAPGLIRESSGVSCLIHEQTPRTTFAAP
jgi:hypothetical protein